MIPATCPVAPVTTNTVTHSLCHFRYLHMKAGIPDDPGHLPGGSGDHHHSITQSLSLQIPPYGGWYPG